MSRAQMLRCLVSERLTAAAEEIFALFERTIAEYEEELCRSKEENQRKQRLLDCAEDRAEKRPGTLEEEAGTSLTSGNSNLCQIKEEQHLCIKWEQEHFQDFTFPPNLDYGKPELEISLAPESHLESDIKQTDHSENNNGGGHHNWESPIDEEIEAEEQNSDRNLESTSEQSLGQTTMTKSSGTKVKPSGRRPRPCSFCDKVFLSKQDLNRHILIHTGEKPFSCSVCEKRFARKGSLRIHTAVHTGERPFSCPVCEKMFAQKGNLNSHMLLHTGEKPFSCPECNAKFPWKATLLRHMKSHSGVRPFSCLVCEKGFVRREHLRVHLRTHKTTEETNSSTAI